MSSQKGNSNRTRSQKYKNKTAFKNNLHDTSKQTKTINGIQINNVCERCKSILEWKIKYKKYKMLKNPSTCCKCQNKNVKEAYHTVCETCSKKLKICPKCGKENNLNASEVPPTPNVANVIESGISDNDDDSNLSFSE